VTFLSPCCLPLVPGYLSFVTGMAGTAGAPPAPAAGPSAPPAPGPDGSAVAVAAPPVAPVAPAAPAPRGRVVAGTALFVLGFSVVFVAYGAALGGLGHLLTGHADQLTRILGGLTILLGLLFAGVFDRFSFAGRIVRPAARPKAGLAGAPLLGVMFGLGWTPCIGPTLTAVLALSASTGTVARGAILAFVYALGLGIPFLLVSLGFQFVMRAFAFARRRARLVTRIGGAMLVAVGLLEVTGAWSSFMAWLQVHWVSSYQPPL
jgi:cytochrome c-type biogenesis protein